MRVYYPWVIFLVMNNINNLEDLAHSCYGLLLFIYIDIYKESPSYGK